MLKRCWNDQLPASEFIDHLSNNQPKEESKEEIVHHLFLICGNVTEPPSFFLEYLKEVFVKMHETVLTVFNSTDQSHIQAVLRLMKMYGNTIFNTFPIESEKVIDFALEIFDNAINQDDKVFLKCLAESVNFSAIIAASRMSKKERLHEICKHMKDKFGIDVNNLTTFFPKVLLKPALSDWPMESPFLFSYHEIMGTIITNIPMACFIPTAFNFIGLQQFKHMYVHFVSDFVNEPSLLLAYSITNLLPRIYYALKTDGNVHAELASTYSEAQLVNMLNECSDCIINDSVYKPGQRRSCDYQFTPEQYEDVKAMLISPPKSLDLNNLAESVFAYPQLASSLIDTILLTFNLEMIDTATSIARQMLSRYNDFNGVLIQQNNFFPFLQSLLDFINEVTDREAFTPMWMLAMTIIRDTWGVGWQKLNREMLDFIDGQSTSVLRSMLRALVQEDTDLYNPPKILKSPTIECVALYQRVAEGTIDFVSAIQKASLRPYLWPSLLLGALKNPDPEKMKFQWGAHPLEPQKLTTLLFHHLMVLLGDPKYRWEWAAQVPDYTLQLRSPPARLKDLSPFLARSLDKLAHAGPLPHSHLLEYLCCWRAWGKIFGVRPFLRLLIDQMIWLSSRVAVPVDADNMFQCAAYIMSVVCNEEGWMVSEVAEAVEDTLDSGLDSTIVAESLARFLLVILCGTTCQWEEPFDAIVERCIKDISSGSPTSARVAFGLTIIRVSLDSNVLRDHIPPEARNALMNVRDWSTLVEYYCVKYPLWD